VYFCVGLLTATTYTLAGWAREQVCTYMCPWPRFQAAMLDEHSLIVTYQKWRGEPRGKHKAGQSWDNRGDCVDCNLCVAVCPTGIDIRDGQQIECIGCSLCVDACTQTMARVGRPAGLIRWDTLASQQAKEKGLSGVRWKPLRARTLLYALLLTVVAAVMVGAFVLRTDTELTVQRDRSPNFVRLSNGDIRNSYTIKILNKRQDEQRFALALAGLPAARLGFIGAEIEGDAAAPRLLVHPDSVGTFRIFVTVPPAAAPAGSQALQFSVLGADGRRRASHDAVFVGPER
jgi:cytochrome c oxidase accessory protein FixG